MLDGDAYPYKPSGTIPLDLISHGNEGLFYYRTALSMDICHMHMYYQHFTHARPTLVKKLSVKQQGTLAQVLTVTHIQTLKMVSYKYLGYDKKCRNKIVHKSQKKKE